jgi:hypothetical protein
MAIRLAQVTKMRVYEGQPGYRVCAPSFVTGPEPISSYRGRASARTPNAKQFGMEAPNWPHQVGQLVDRFPFEA